jgi:hypothetical protein
MPMQMGMWLCHSALMGVLVVIIMSVQMIMFRVVMHMFMLMTLGQMNPQANGHENACDNQLD